MIAINFASRNYRLLELARRSLLAGCVILALAATALMGKAAALRADGVAVKRLLAEAQADDLRVEAVLAERERLSRDLSAMSGLIDARKFSWTRLLSSIEAVVPVGVALKKVAFNPGSRTLGLDGMAQSPEALRNLVVGLEKSSSFRDPFLKHQSLEKGSISFNVVAVYQEHTGALVAQGKR
jgi:Tfp pilus assembly protein PilN